MKGYLSIGDPDEVSKKIIGANSYMIQPGRIKPQDYLDFKYRASSNFTKAWNDALTAFMKISNKARKKGERIKKWFEKFDEKYADSEFFADQDTYDKVWERIEDLIEKGDLEEITWIVTEMNIHYFVRSPLPDEIEVDEDTIPSPSGEYYWNAIL